MAADLEKFSELFGNQKRRERTLNVDEDTYLMITRVAAATGKSRPKVIASFVATAYEIFRREAMQEGIDLDEVDLGKYTEEVKKSRSSRKTE